jgi:threonine dehydrogenase-like Zn-dependent dehydrogenase
MKAIANTAPGRLELLDLPMPVPGPGQVRIQTGACGICATDLLMIAGWERTGFPAIPGHEWAGTVAAVGPGVDPALLTRRCVADNILPGGEVGFEYPGGYAEYFLTDAAGLRLLPDGFPLAVAALAEPLGVCLRAIRRLRPQNLGRALVLGDGPIGLLLLLLLRRAGASEVMLVGGRSGRLALARDLGASLAIDHRALGEQPAQAILAQASGPFPIVVEASGSPDGMRAAMGVAQNSGRILVLGDYGQARADFRWVDLLHQEFELIGSNTGSGAWDEAVELLVSGELPIHRLISHRFAAGQYAQAFELVRSGQEDIVKVVMEW